MKRQLDILEDVEESYPKNKRSKVEFHQEVGETHSKIKNFKFQSQQVLIRNIMINCKDENIVIMEPGSIEKLSKEQFPKIKESNHIPKLLFEFKSTNKPTICMICNSKFYACSFTLSEEKDLQDCCLQTLRSYHLQRRLCLVRNPFLD